MREKKAPRPDLRGAPGDQIGAGSSSQVTAPTPYCRCARTGDLWACQGRPELVSHPDGAKCSLGATVRASGNDHDLREELERALKGEGADR